MDAIERVGIVWHGQSVATVLRDLATGREGLSDEEASRRLDRFGANRLTPPAPVSARQILLAQLRSVVVLLLIAAMAISMAMRDWLDAAAIAAVLVINTAIGFATELRARRAMDALRQFDVPRAAVVRGGALRVLSSETLVPGDVIELAPGQHVPADARLIDANDLRTIEATLTGESLPVSKTADDVLATDTVLADRTNMVYKGTTVAAGLARAAVVATGMATEVGRIGTLVAGLHEERTPLERRLDALGRRLVWLALAVAALVALLGVIQGAPLAFVVQTGIALAVAAVPEALPAVATIALAVGLHRMARRHALVRRLPAVEALGSTTVVCTDKTRTLTSGQMTVVRIWTGGDELDLAHVGYDFDPGARRLLEIAARASRAQATAGGEQPAVLDPVDLAVLNAAHLASVDVQPDARIVVTGVPFSHRRKFMAAFHQVGGSVIAYVKGAPGTILPQCDRMFDVDGERPLDAHARQQLDEANARLAGGGLRVLAVACGPVSAADESALQGLSFVGLLGLMDPPAAGVKDTIARLRRAGLRTIMLTGDQRLTAEAVGRDLGMWADGTGVVDGRELEALSESALAARVGTVAAFSRISPEHKLAIVRSLQARGEIVAMLGDGVNDAAALKQADVGVAMGRGTDVAKEAAAIVLQNDRFETIAAAVEQGRVIYDNIVKFVFYLFSCNAAEVLVLLVTAIAGLPQPLLPLQILWLNIVTDTFPALALAMEPGDADVMQRPPRDPQESLLSPAFLTRVVGYGLLITASTVAALVWSLDDPARTTTVCFMTLALAQIFHLGNARSVGPVLRPARIVANPLAIGAVCVSVCLQVATMQVAPLAALLRVAPLGIGDWVVIVGLAAVPAVVGQLLKAARLDR